MNVITHMIRRMFNFDSQLTPYLIKLVLAISLLSGGLLTLGMIIGGIGMALHDGEVVVGILIIFASMFFLLLWLLLSRCFCELLLLGFQLHDTMKAIRDRLPAPPTATAPAPAPFSSIVSKGE